jgi:tetratricopeptide (TPR) repeat protein
MSQSDYEEALKFFQSALDMTEMDEEKYETYINIAIAESKLGNKNKARGIARKALSIKPNDSKAFNIIGNLYYSSFEECKGGESKVLDRAIFIAAYEAYKKAGNTEQMSSTKEQFPSIEEIFNEGYEEGTEVRIGCWVNETVALQRRD